MCKLFDWKKKTLCISHWSSKLFNPVSNFIRHSWWRHQMETFSALLALWAGNSPVPVNSPHKGQWRGGLMFSLICTWINGWVNNREAGDLRRHRGHYDVNVMWTYDIYRCSSRLLHWYRGNHIVTPVRVTLSASKITLWTLQNRTALNHIKGQQMCIILWLHLIKLVSGFVTGCPCIVWYRWLTICALYIGPTCGKSILCKVACEFDGMENSSKFFL